MCLSIPSKVVSINKEKNSAILDTMGVTREASLELMEEGSIHVDDYVLLHVGFVMNKIDKEDALESLQVFEGLLGAMDEEERQKSVLESDNCSHE